MSRIWQKWRKALFDLPSTHFSVDPLLEKTWWLFSTLKSWENLIWGLFFNEWKKLKLKISSNFFYIYPKEKHPSDVSSKKYLKFLFQIFYEVEWIFLIQLTRTSAQILFCFEAVCFDIFFPHKSRHGTDKNSRRLRA